MKTLLSSKATFPGAVGRSSIFLWEEHNPAEQSETMFCFGGSLAKHILWVEAGWCEAGPADWEQSGLWNSLALLCAFLHFQDFLPPQGRIILCPRWRCCYCHCHRLLLSLRISVPYMELPKHARGQHTRRHCPLGLSENWASHGK